MRLECEKGSLDIVNYIRESGVSLEGEHGIIESAIDGNCLEVLESLLRYEIQPCYTDLVNVCIIGFFEMVKLLYAYGAADHRESNKKVYTLLHKYNFESIDDEGEISEILEFFLRIGVDIDPRNGQDQTVLQNLCESDRNFAVIINVPMKFIAYNFAYCGGGSKIVQFLLRNGLSIN